MAIDFPNSPTVGQVFTSGGISWIWNGTVWASLNVAGWTDAPSDGVTYGRKNASWSSVDALLAPALQAGSDNTGRNLLHNSMFNIAQRGGGPWTASSYTADRWMVVANNDTFTSSVSALSPGGVAAVGDEAQKNILGVNVTGNAAAGSYTALQQLVEGVARTSNKTVTLSFYAGLAAGTANITVELTQVFGTGGSPSAQVTLPQQTVQVSATWARYSLTFNVPSIVGKILGTNNNDCLYARFWLSNPALAVGRQTANFGFWGMQLEVGSQATALEKLDPRNDLANCQRFYVNDATPIQTGFYAWAASAWQSLNFRFPMPMRATPTVTVGVTSGNTNISSQNLGNQSAYGFILQSFAGGAGGASIMNAGYTATADL